MQGLIRLTYWLGWIFLALAIIARAATYTAMSERIVYAALLPRNFLQLSFLFFIACIATALVHRQTP